MSESALATNPRRLRLRGRITSLANIWRTSLRARVITIILFTSLLAMVLIGGTVIATVRTQIFDRAVDSAINQFEASYASAESAFSAASTPNVGQIQQIANAVVSSQYDAAGSVAGAALLRSPGGTEGFQILEPATQSSTEIRSLLTAQLRDAVQNTDSAHWQSVDLGGQGGEPGIVIGQRLQLPGAGMYELYIAYSLHSQENTISMVMRLLTLGFVALLSLLGIITYLVVRMVLRPVRDASEKARLIADGNYEVRMDVDGEDELATLARSFNQMASSIEDQIERYERVSNVQQGFVSAVSHELRSPVTTIRMAGQLIYDQREQLPPGLKRSAELQHEQLINLDTMLSDLLEISRYDAGAMTLATEEADIADIVVKAILDQRPLAAANAVSVDFDTHGPTTAEVEARRIERIVRNLIVNALEHAEGKPVRVRVVGSQAAVAVEVSDHGVGLSEEHAAHVFDRFWRADSSRVRKSGGTGLGLTIAREDAELHGGTLECAGELGVGATFVLTIPRVVGQAPDKPVPLRVVAAEEEWLASEDVPGIETHELVASMQDTAEIPRIHVEGTEADEGDIGPDVSVHVPSSGVAVIVPGEGSAGEGSASEGSAGEGSASEGSVREHEDGREVASASGEPRGDDAGAAPHPQAREEGSTQ